MAESVEIKKNSVEAALAAIAVVAVFAFAIAFGLGSNSYAFLFVVSFAAILIAGRYVHTRKHNLDDMCCMMAGMTFAMTAGLSPALL